MRAGLQRSPLRRIRVYNRNSFPLQVIHQARLCLEVPLHSAVIVEVVACQVCKDSDIELESIQACLIEAVRGDLHRNRPYAAISELPKNSLQLHGPWSRESAAARQNFALAADQYAQRPDRRTRPIAVVEEMTHDRGRRGFTIRSGHA